MGAAKNVSKVTDLEEAILHFLNDKKELTAVESKLETYFAKNSGTTKKVLGFINWD